MNAHTTDQREPTIGQAVKRIMMLEAIGVGCGPTCGCRAFFAASMTDEQSAMVETQANAVIFNHAKKSDIGAVKTMLGDTMSPLQIELLDHIGRDAAISPFKDVAGGGRGAILALASMTEIGSTEEAFGANGEKLREHHERRSGAKSDEPAFA